MSGALAKYEQNREIDVDKLVSFSIKNNQKPGHNGLTVTCDGCGTIIMQGNCAYVTDTYFSPAADSPLDFCSDCIERFRLKLYLPSAQAYAQYVAAKLHQKASKGESWHINAKTDFDEEAEYVPNSSTFMSRVESRLEIDFEAQVEVVTQSINGKTICTGLEITFPDAQNCTMRASLSTPNHRQAFGMSRSGGEYVLIDKRK